MAARLAALEEQLRDQLGPDRFGELADGGELLPIEQAVRLAESKLTEVPRRNTPSNASPP
jgi:hypothetical protein